MTVWNEAMYYFHLAPEAYERVLFVLRDYSEECCERRAEYYVRTYRHLMPDGVTIIECDEETGAIRKFWTTVHTNVYRARGDDTGMITLLGRRWS